MNPTTLGPGDLWTERDDIQPMNVYVASHSSATLHYLAGKTERIGWLLGPGTLQSCKPRKWLKLALDNGRFGCWRDGRTWDGDEYKRFLDDALKLKMPIEWALVPDVVGHRQETLDSWHQWYLCLRQRGFKLAFAAQDGMTPDDIPHGADVVFVGGSTRWKWRNAAAFCSAFPRVHIGRVNNLDRLVRAEEMGAESVDGTQFFRTGEDGRCMRHLLDYFAGKRGHRRLIEV